jgi:hypothetical protein
MATSDVVGSCRDPSFDCSVRVLAPIIQALEGVKPPSEAVRDEHERLSSSNDCKAKPSAICSFSI